VRITGIALGWIDLDGILRFFSDDASIDCECGGLKIVTGREALSAYWGERLRSHPAEELDDLRPAPGGASLTHTSAGGPVRAILEFDADGKVSLLRCSPVQEG
jgi:hypothetical protein